MWRACCVRVRTVHDGLLGMAIIGIEYQQNT